MFDNINLYKPDKIIRLSELSDSNEIYDIMKKMGARSYAYGIGYQPDDELRIIFVKIGRSSPEKDRKGDVHGERLVRQVAHLSGWNSTNKRSANGTDYLMGLNEAVAANKLPPRALQKNNTCIGIWNCHQNFRNCKVEATELEQSRWLEAYLCKLYKNDFNDELPLLNKIDPASGSILKKYITPKIITQSGLFEFK
jgi:hypothetical protein